MASSQSQKSKVTSPTRTAMKCGPKGTGAGSPRISARKVEAARLSPELTMVWSSRMAMSDSDLDRQVPGNRVGVVADLVSRPQAVGDALREQLRALGQGGVGLGGHGVIEQRQPAL